MTSLCFFQNTFILRRPRVAIFADIINILSMVIKKSLLKQAQKKLKELEIMYQNASISVFLDIGKFTDCR